MSPVSVPTPTVPVRAEVASQFALLADPLRLKIVESLSREQLCTCHLVDITGARQTTISNHLRLLREAGVVVSEPEGRYTWYRLAPGAFTQALRALAGFAHDGPDAARLRPACATPVG
ncbi:helix-turn-helix transcriptional regulator [Cellulomonas sp. APG4]|jgi:ArsR family transcriptional regulator|uniref:ArsR/SmtB family transcription factor n=1 Tax=Cellulomonas TaxID=1707 RepID=UPI0009DC95A3|nr:MULTISPECIES: metalloregulator ArsR/SmtB family transcription factor [Cellulomonas]NCT89515.1 helix-turn-helix transcriptional regulator [Cellulomonas sp. APG4]GGC14369.1 transcriptional regulator [Cellulomonas carbonis]